MTVKAENKQEEKQKKQKPAEPKEAIWTDEKLRNYASLTAQEYIEERFNPMRAWYDKKSASTKNLYLRMRATSVVGGAIVPVLINLHIAVIPEIIIDLLTTAISLIVVVFVSLESVFHYREQWKNYRSTEQQMANEYFKFVSGEGPYKKSSEKDAFILFVNRIEGAIEREGASTLNIMTTVTDQKAKSANTGK